MAVLWQVLFASAAWKSCRSSRVLAQESRLLHGPIYFYLSLFSFFFLCTIGRKIQILLKRTLRGKNLYSL